MNLSNEAVVRSLLTRHGFSFKKSLGQNFLIDPDVCPAMAAAAADDTTGVLEIGPGFGVLTRECAKVAKKVVAVELDQRLCPVLNETLEGLDNAEVVFGDALTMDLAGLIADRFADCEKVAVCANLPYYITSPLIMKLLGDRLPVDNVTVMVQKEAAERLCAPVGTREAGAVTVAVAYYAQPRLLFTVSHEAFMPSPKVDSAVIQLSVLPQPPVQVRDETAFFAMVKGCFAQRRKTLANTLANTLGYDKQAVFTALGDMGLDPSVRSERLTLSQLADLYARLS